MKQAHTVSPEAAWIPNWSPCQLFLNWPSELRRTGDWLREADILLAAFRVSAWRRLLAFFFALFPRAAMVVLLCEK